MPESPKSGEVSSEKKDQKKQKTSLLFCKAICRNKSCLFSYSSLDSICPITCSDIQNRKDPREEEKVLSFLSFFNHNSNNHQIFFFFSFFFSFRTRIAECYEWVSFSLQSTAGKKCQKKRRRGKNLIGNSLIVVSNLDTVFFSPLFFSCFLFFFDRMSFHLLFPFTSKSLSTVSKQAVESVWRNCIFVLFSSPNDRKLRKRVLYQIEVWLTPRKRRDIHSVETS